MNDLVTIKENNGQSVVSGRELHAALKVKTKYEDWFPRMVKYGFEAEKDYFSNLRIRSDGFSGKPQTDHLLTLDTAKEISMLQRTENGKLIRRYFIEAEKELRKSEKQPCSVSDLWLPLYREHYRKVQDENRALKDQVKTLSQEKVINIGNQPISILVNAAVKTIHVTKTGSVTVQFYKPD